MNPGNTLGQSQITLFPFWQLPRKRLSLTLISQGVENLTKCHIVKVCYIYIQGVPTSLEYGHKVSVSEASNVFQKYVFLRLCHINEGIFRPLCIHVLRETVQYNAINQKIVPKKKSQVKPRRRGKARAEKPGNCTD